MKNHPPLPYSSPVPSSSFPSRQYHFLTTVLCPTMPSRMCGRNSSPIMRRGATMGRPARGYLVNDNNMRLPPSTRTACPYIPSGRHDNTLKDMENSPSQDWNITIGFSGECSTMKAPLNWNRQIQPPSTKQPLNRKAKTETLASSPSLSSPG